MTPTQRYRDQHAEILQIANQISAYLEPGRLPAGAAEVRRLLSSLAGTLKHHLAVEDDSLYPRLRGHADPKLRAMATAFSGEMSGLKGAFQAYNQKWSERAIAANAGDFARETQGVFAALAKRIQRENTELYALVDSLDLAVAG
jgi:hypothetical protein